MKRFKTAVTLFLAGLPFASSHAQKAADNQNAQPNHDDLDAVDLSPLNLPGQNLFAAHRSHSSHSSHSSHRSSSGGYSGYSDPTPASASPDERVPVNSLYSEGSRNSSSASSVVKQPAAPQLTRAEKLKLQVMRVQISLTTLGIYAGMVHGDLDDLTKEAIKRFQLVKGLPANGLMTTETLNALSVPAVQ